MPDLESQALDGTLFRARSPSPSRSSASTPPPQNTDDELGSDLSRPASPAHHAHLPSQASQTPATGEAQTGPKGVISDKRAHTVAARLERDARVKATRRQQERKGLVSQTNGEEEEGRERERLLREMRESQREEEMRESQREEEMREQRRRERRMEEIEREGGKRRGGAGLREVGKEGFLGAVERRGWVVVLIYEPAYHASYIARCLDVISHANDSKLIPRRQDLPRCQPLLASLLHLQLNLPETPTPISLFRARATKLAFSLLPGPDADDDADDRGYLDDQDEYDSEDGGGRRGRRADPDVLPTLLVYKDGDLEKTWVRVDWEVGEGGVEGLLRREGIISEGMGRLTGQARNLMDERDDEE